MRKQHIHIGVEDAERGFERFIEVWHKAEVGEIEQAEIHLNFETDTKAFRVDENIASAWAVECPGIVKTTGA